MAGNDDNIDDENIYIDYDDNSNEETISKMLNDIADSKKRRLSNDNELTKNKIMKGASNSLNQSAPSVRSGSSQSSHS